VGLGSNLAALARFPASQPYDSLSSLKDKLYALPFYLAPVDTVPRFIYQQAELSNITFKVDNKDFHHKLLACYVTGLGKQTITWENNTRFTVSFTKNLPVGRVRLNCTAPSKTYNNRFYWYSHPWFILDNNGKWYTL
jgi:hypothetical protein